MMSTYHFTYFPNENGKPVYPNGVPFHYLKELTLNMKFIVEKFFNGDPLSQDEFYILKEYFLYWAMYPKFFVNEELITKLVGCQDVECLHQINNELIDNGIDIF